MPLLVKTRNHTQNGGAEGGSAVAGGKASAKTEVMMAWTTPWEMPNLDSSIWEVVYTHA